MTVLFFRNSLTPEQTSKVKAYVKAYANKWNKKLPRQVQVQGAQVCAWGVVIGWVGETLEQFVEGADAKRLKATVKPLTGIPNLTDWL